MDAAGVKVPADIQGRSFLPLLKGEKPKDWRTSMYYRYYHYPQDHKVQPHYGVRTERYKLIYFNKIDQWELFDLKTDPHELKNVYADPAQMLSRLYEIGVRLGENSAGLPPLPPCGDHEGLDYHEGLMHLYDSDPSPGSDPS